MSDLPVVTPPCIINPQFYASSVATMKEISKWKMKPITLFPQSQIITDGDIFFKRIWSMIDSSNHYFWLTTYAFDSSPAADTTLLKLISASKRGVNVVLLIDNVQAWPKRELVEQFEQCGGRFHILNTQFGWKDIKKYFSKTVWCRHHEKLIVSDGRGLIGSSNIEGDYGGVLFGSRKFQDLNYYT